jgi:hypothetical protein
MSTTTSKSKAATLAGVLALIAGTQKHFPSAQFTLGETVYTTASLLQPLQKLVAVMTALNAAQQAAKDALTALESVEPTVQPLIRLYVKFLRATFSTAQALADFGLEAPKPRAPLTGQKRVAATAKLRATRTARGTTSKKQKLTVTGNVTGVNITPTTTPASPEQPAPVSPGAPTTGTATKS